MNIGDTIKKHRLSAMMSQKEMADRLGVSASAVNKWEKGGSSPDIAMLAPIAGCLISLLTNYYRSTLNYQQPRLN